MAAAAPVTCVVASSAIASTAAPGNTAFPTVSGTAQVGLVLTAVNGTWTGAPAPAYSYQWQRCESASVAGVTWTSRTSAADNVWRAVTWGGPAGQETFVAVAQSGVGNRVMTSPDGSTWTSRSSAAGSDWLSVAWGGPAGQEKFVAVAQTAASSARVMTSPDGVTWTLQSATDSDWTSVVWAGPAGQQQFVAVARAGTDRVMTSPDGVSWTARTAAAAQQWRSLTWGGPAGQEAYVAVSRTGTGQRAMTSPDGVTWTLRNTPADIDWRSVTWGGPTGNEVFVAVGRNGTAANLVMTSPDGITWTLRQAAADREWQSVTWGGPPGQERFVAVGEGSAGALDLVMTSRDGITWVPGQSVGGNEWAGVTWGGPPGDESFVAVGAAGTGNRVMTSSQGQCTDIPSATARTYTAQPADHGQYLRVQVTASNGVAPDGMAYSDPSGQVAAAAPATPQSATGVAASPTSPQAATGTAALSARLLPQRTRLVSGQKMRLAIRARNTGTVAAQGVTSCIRLPANLVVVRKGSALRSGRTLCFRVGDVAVGGQATRVVTVRAVAARDVSRTIIGTARATGASRVSAPATRVSIRPRAVRTPVTG